MFGCMLAALQWNNNSTRMAAWALSQPTIGCCGVHRTKAIPVLFLELQCLRIPAAHRLLDRLLSAKNDRGQKVAPLSTVGTLSKEARFWLDNSRLNLEWSVWPVRSNRATEMISREMREDIGSPVCSFFQLGQSAPFDLRQVSKQGGSYAGIRSGPGEAGHWLF